MSIVPFSKNAEAITLDELFATARAFGKVTIFTTDQGYNCVIEFITSIGTDVKSRSPFDCQTPHVAVQIAIEKAKEIRSQFK